MNDVIINFKKLRKIFPAKIKSVIEHGWTTEEIRKMLDVCSNTKQRAIIHFENPNRSESSRQSHFFSVEPVYRMNG